MIVWSRNEIGDGWWPMHIVLSEADARFTHRMDAKRIRCYPTTVHVERVPANHTFGSSVHLMYWDGRA